MLQEQCCFWVNPLGQVQKHIRNVTQRASNLKDTASQACLTWENARSWMSWLLPFLWPLASIFLLLLFRPCLSNFLGKFVSSHLQAIKLQMVPSHQLSANQHSGDDIILWGPLGQCSRTNELRPTVTKRWDPESPTTPLLSRKQLERKDTVFPKLLREKMSGSWQT